MRIAVTRMKAAEQFGQHLHVGQIAAACGNGPFHDVVVSADFPLCLVHQF